MTETQTVCGNCGKPIHYTVGSFGGLWFHDESGGWACRAAMYGETPVAHTHPHGPICSEDWCGSPRRSYR